jgi:hypothetical protein
MEKKLGPRFCFVVKGQDFQKGGQPSSSTNTRNISPLFVFKKGDNPQNIHFREEQDRGPVLHMKCALRGRISFTYLFYF